MNTRVLPVQKTSPPTARRQQPSRERIGTHQADATQVSYNPPVGTMPGIPKVAFFAAFNRLSVTIRTVQLPIWLRTHIFQAQCHADSWELRMLATCTFHLLRSVAVMSNFMVVAWFGRSHGCAGRKPCVLAPGTHFSVSISRGARVGTTHVWACGVKPMCIRHIWIMTRITHYLDDTEPIFRLSDPQCFSGVNTVWGTRWGPRRFSVLNGKYSVWRLLNLTFLASSPTRPCVVSRFNDCFIVQMIEIIQSLINNHRPCLPAKQWGWIITKEQSIRPISKHVW